MRQNLKRGKGRHGKGDDKKVWNKLLPICLLILCIAGCTFSDKNRAAVAHDEQGDSIPVLTENKIVGNAKTPFEMRLDSLGFVDIGEISPLIRIDLKYATNGNFTGKVLYECLSRAYLHPLAAGKLLKAQQLLHQADSSLYLLVYDAARPWSVQKIMYDAVKDTPYKAYVANPERTSLHNYGMAVDLTICDKDTIPLDMGTEFDYFGSKAGINREEQLVHQGVLSQVQVNNRRLLRKIMQEAGFIPIIGEWWHFNACSVAEAKRISSLIQ